MTGEKEQQDFGKIFESKRVSGLSPEDKRNLRELFQKLSKEQKDDFLKKYKDLSSLKEPERSFINTLESDLKVLKEDIKIKKVPDTYKELQESFKDNEAMKDLLDIFGDYIDLKFDDNFSTNEKETIKLAIFGEIQKDLNATAIFDKITSQVLSPIKGLINSFNNKKTFEKGDFSTSMSDIETEFDKIGISLVTKMIDEKVEKINATKKQNKKFDNLEDVLKITNPEDAKKITKESIQKNTLELAEKLKKGRESGENIKAGLNGLPMGLGETITGWLKDLSKEYPIVGFFLSLFLGKDFLNNGLDSRKKSISKLEEFSKKDTFPLKDKIKTEQLKDLDSKKLEKFYKYLDSKEIDYSTDTFWEELLTGKTKDEKIKELYNLLTSNGTNKGILKNDELKGNILDNFIEKLNGLEEFTENETKLAKDQRIVELETGTITASVAAISTKTKPETAKKQLTKEEQDELNKLKFEKSVLGISKLPAEIFYKGNKLKLDISGKNIVLGDKTFGIKVNTQYGDKFENIEFKDGYFYVNGDTRITKEQVKDLISSLMDKDTFSYKGKIQKPIIGNIDYELVIQKA